MLVKESRAHHMFNHKYFVSLVLPFSFKELSPSRFQFSLMRNKCKDGYYGYILLPNQLLKQLTINHLKVIISLHYCYKFPVITTVSPSITSRLLHTQEIRTVKCQESPVLCSKAAKPAHTRSE